ncbi:MAG: acetate uptake transporter [Candidatus Geothermincolia bacterium]
MEDAKLANPAVLGLTCFGMTTILLNLHNVGLFKQDAPILAMGIFLGGLVQIMAGAMEFKKGNTFGMTAFSAFGAFWLTLVFILMVKPNVVNNLGLDPSARGFAWYLLLWGLFTACMFVGTLKANRVLQAVFAQLFVLFILLAVHFAYFTKAGSSGAVLKAAGVVGILTGASAIYLAIAELLNEMYGKVMLPIGPMAGANKNPGDLYEEATA